MALTDPFGRTITYLRVSVTDRCDFRCVYSMSEDMIAFIDDHRQAHGVEPICKVLPIAPSTYLDHAAKRADSARLSARAKRDIALKAEIERVFEENFRVYGARKVWLRFRREGFDVALCSVERLMREIGLCGRSAASR